MRAFVADVLNLDRGILVLRLLKLFGHGLEGLLKWNDVESLRGG